MGGGRVRDGDLTPQPVWEDINGEYPEDSFLPHRRSMVSNTSQQCLGYPTH